LVYDYDFGSTDDKALNASGPPRFHFTESRSCDLL
jgi:hypothetical protein